jgi:hypothetical protein
MFQTVDAATRKPNPTNSPLQSRANHLPTKHRHLIPKHHQFDVLGRLAAATGRGESEQHPEDRRAENNSQMIMPLPQRTRQA